jgi:alpha-glucosidase
MASFSWQETRHTVGSLGAGSALAAAAYFVRQRLQEAWQRATRLPGRGLWHPGREQSEVEALGDLVSYERKEGGLALSCDNGTLLLEVLADDLIRIRLRSLEQGDFPPLFSYALDPQADWPPVRFSVEEAADSLAVHTGQVGCHLTRAPLWLNFRDAQGQPLSEAAGDDGASLGFWQQGVFCTRRLAEGEAIYGLGEKAFGLNLRGRSLEIWNRDPAVYAPGDDPINLNIPFLIGLREGRAYGFFFDNPGRARFDLGQARPDRLRYEADQGELCLYFFGGASIPAILERYTQLTGRMPMPPRWMLGYQQSRWSYYPEQQVRDLAAELRRRRIPCDAIHLDIHYMDGYRIFTWDRERFPEPARLLADLRAEGFRVISILDPGVKVDPGYAVYEEGLDQDLFCRLANGRLFQGPVWPGQCHFPDFTSPRVREWWGGLYRSLLAEGVSGFWNDMNEPSIFGGEMPPDVRHDYDGRGASHGEVHNVYGLQMARASAEGLRRLRSDERIPVISRAGYAGLQRYALVWTADNQSTWAQLRLGISMCLNLGLSGIALCGPDVGGFSGDCEGELLARWTQVGALTPFFRNHSALGSAQQEPWAFGEPYESICRRWIELRYELLPYLYTAAWQAAESGLPMMRPLSLAFPHDLRTYSLDDQFLLGDALLAAPVGYPGQRSRPVYLPGETWHDFWTGQPQSGTVTADAPLERMPLYVRAGAVLPMGPVLQHTGQWPPGALGLHVYPGTGESWLYEDDGHSMAYRSGQFQLTRFVLDSTRQGLRLRREVEGPFDPGYARFDITIHGLGSAPQSARVDGQPTPVLFDPNEGTARLAVGEWQALELLGLQEGR